MSLNHLAIAAVLASAALSGAPALAQAPASAPNLVVAQALQPDVWDKIKGNWTRAKGMVKEQWGRLTDDDITAIEGRRDQLVGKLQARYGISIEDAEKQVSGWEKSYR